MEPGCGQRTEPPSSLKNLLAIELCTLPDISMETPNGRLPFKFPYKLYHVLLTEDMGLKTNQFRL